MTASSQEGRRPSLARLITFSPNFSFINRKRKISADSAISGISRTTPANAGVIKYIGTPYPSPPSSPSSQSSPCSPFSPFSFPSSISTQECSSARHARADRPVIIYQTREILPQFEPLTSYFSNIPVPGSSQSEYSDTSPSLSGSFLDPRSPPKPGWIKMVTSSLERWDQAMDSVLEARKRRQARKRKQRAAEVVARENITETLGQVSPRLSKAPKVGGRKRRLTLKRKEKGKSQKEGNEDETKEKAKKKLKRTGEGKFYLFPAWMPWARRKPASAAGRITPIPPREANNTAALLSQPEIQRRSVRHPAKKPLVASGTIPRTRLSRGNEVPEEEEGSAEESFVGKWLAAIDEEHTTVET